MRPKMKKRNKFVTIGLIQTKVSENSELNVQKTVRLIEKAAKKGAKIICLQELFKTPYFCQGPKDKKNFSLAETVPGPTTALLSRLAKEYRIVILCSIFEKTKAKGKEKKYYNSLVVIGTQGEIIGTYHKIHIPSLPKDYYSENYYFEKGKTDFKVFKTEYGTIGTLICYDQWFPEAARRAALKGAQILFYPTAIGWPKNNPKWKKKAEYEAWQITQRSHGIDNNIFIASVNRIGMEKDIQFWGSSFVSDPYGRLLGSASTSKEEILIVPVDFSVTKKMREEWPFLDERKIKLEKVENA